MAKETVSFRADKEEKKRWAFLAKKEKITLSKLIRTTMNKIAPKIQ